MLMSAAAATAVAAEMGGESRLPTGSHLRRIGALPGWTEQEKIDTLDKTCLPKVSHYHRDGGQMSTEFFPHILIRLIMYVYCIGMQILSPAAAAVVVTH